MAFPLTVPELCLAVVNSFALGDSRRLLRLSALDGGSGFGNPSLGMHVNCFRAVAGKGQRSGGGGKRKKEEKKRTQTWLLPACPFGDMHARVFLLSALSPV